MVHGVWRPSGVSDNAPSLLAGAQHWKKGKSTFPFRIRLGSDLLWQPQIGGVFTNSPSGLPYGRDCHGCWWYFFDLEVALVPFSCLFFPVSLLLHLLLVRHRFAALVYRKSGCDDIGVTTRKVFCDRLHDIIVLALRQAPENAVHTLQRLQELRECDAWHHIPHLCYTAWLADRAFGVVTTRLGLAVRVIAADFEEIVKLVQPESTTSSWESCGTVES